MSGEQLVIGLLVFHAGGSVWVGVSLALYFSPMLFFGAPAGVLADSVDRRRLLVLVEVVQALVLVAMGLVIATDLASLYVLLALTFMSGTVRAFHHPAKLGYAFDLSGPDKAVAMLGRVNVATRLGQLTGGLVGGWLTGSVGPEAALFAVAAGHGAGALAMLGLRTEGRVRSVRTESTWDTLREFAREIWTNAELRLMVTVLAVVEIFGYAYQTLLPELATVRLQLGPEGLGALHAMRGFGGLVAALFLSRAVRQSRLGCKYLVIVTGFGLMLLALAVSDDLLLVCLLVTSVAACAAAGDVLAQSILQLCVPDRLRGRAMGIWVLAVGTGPVGHLQMGALAGAAGLGFALSLNGLILMTVGGGCLLFAARLRRL